MEPETEDMEDVEERATGAAPCVGRSATTADGLHALWRHCVAEGHAVTLSFGGRAFLALPLGVHGDRFTYWRVDRERPETHTPAMIREVVDLGRSLDAIEARGRGEAPPRRPGRPRIHDAPRRDVFLRLPDALVSEMDAAAGEGHRTTWVEAAVREKLARDV